jgi:hypothetical protein
MWRAFCQHLKECGRNGSLFIFALPVVLAGALLATTLGKFALATVWSIWTALLARAFFKFVHDWRHPARLGRFPALSSEDLRVARSKLTKQRTQRLN